MIYTLHHVEIYIIKQNKVISKVLFNHFLLLKLILNLILNRYQQHFEIDFILFCMILNSSFNSQMFYFNEIMITNQLIKGLILNDLLHNLIAKI